MEIDNDIDLERVNSNKEINLNSAQSSFSSISKKPILIRGFIIFLIIIVALIFLFLISNLDNFSFDNNNIIDDGMNNNKGIDNNFNDVNDVINNDFIINDELDNVSSDDLGKYFEIVDSNFSLNECDEINDENLLNQCNYIFAIENEDVDFCKTLEIEENINYCIYEIAKNLNDLNYCYNINNSVEIDKCIIRFSYGALTKEVCDKLENIEFKDFCYFEIKSCDEIGREELKLDCVSEINE